MDMRTMLVELLLSGFFAVACIRACVPTSTTGKLNFASLLRFPGRWERLHRSRWQWFSMVGLLLVLRLQGGLPFILEAIAVLEFAIFLALPAIAPASERKRGNANETVVGSR
jgi:hypothetical protein